MSTLNTDDPWWVLMNQDSHTLVLKNNIRCILPGTCLRKCQKGNAFHTVYIKHKLKITTLENAGTCLCSRRPEWWRRSWSGPPCILEAPSKKSLACAAAAEDPQLSNKLQSQCTTNMFNISKACNTNTGHGVISPWRKLNITWWVVFSMSINLGKWCHFTSLNPGGICMASTTSKTMATNHKVNAQ